MKHYSTRVGTQNPGMPLRGTIDGEVREAGSLQRRQVQVEVQQPQENKQKHP